MNDKVQEHINRVKLFKENKFIVKNNFEAIDISTGIDWKYKHHSNQRTYQVYLHSLGILKSLVISAKHLENSENIELGKKLILNWYNGEFDRNNSQAWHEHAVSSRIQNLIYFQERSQENKLDDDIFQDLLLKHCEFLSDKKNYHENNHGIMMDNSLLIASEKLLDEKLKKNYCEKVYYRTKIAFYRDFSKMGVHLENSPEYHKMVLGLLTRVSKNLSNLNMPLGKDISSLLFRAKMYMSYVTKPDGTLPLIGDTGLLTINDKKNYIDFIDHEAGVIISQFKNLKDEKLSSWLLFKSGYSSKTHKHKDDLSINLFMNGHDILVDSGKYSYDMNDPIRDFIVSPEAHNTIYFKESNYNFSNSYSDQIKLKTTNFSNRGQYKIGTGINNLYAEGNITRHSILTRDKILIVLDNINSNDENEVIQNFNFPEDTRIKKISINKFEIQLEERVYILESFDIGYNKPLGEVQNGYLSYSFGKYVENKRIEYTNKGKKLSFITFLFEKHKDKDVKNVIFKNGIISYDAKGKTYQIFV